MKVKVFVQTILMAPVLQMLTKHVVQSTLLRRLQGSMEHGEDILHVSH